MIGRNPENKYCNNKGSSVSCINTFTFMAISIMTLWISTFQIATLVSSIYLPTPTFAAVKQTCINSYNLILEQKSLFKKCAESSVSLCFTRFKTSKVSRDGELQSLYNRTSRALDQISAMDATCSANFSNFMPSLVDWDIHLNNYTIGEGNNSRVKDMNSCTIEKLNIIHNASIEVQSSLERNSLISSTEDLVFGALNYAKALNEYNMNYLSIAKTAFPELVNISVLNNSIRWRASLTSWAQAIQQGSKEVERCFGIMNIDGSVSDDPSTCPTGNSVRTKLQDVYNSAKRRVGYLASQYDYLQTQANGYKSDIKSAVDKMNSFYSSINGALGLISWLKKQKIIDANLNLCDKSSPDWCQFSLSDFAVEDIQILDNKFDELLPLNFNDLFGDSYLQEKGRLNASYQELTGLAKEFYDDVVASLGEIQANLFSNYNPPIYSGKKVFDINLIKEEVRFKNELLRNNSRQASERISAMALPAGSFINSFPAIASEVPMSSIDLLWHPVGFSDIDVESIINSLFDLNSIFIVIDLVYLLVSTVTIVVKAYRGKLVEIDPFDCRLDEHKSKIDEKTKTTVQMMYRVLSTSWLQLAVLLAALGAIAFTAVRLLEFEFNSYRGGCVDLSAPLTSSITTGYSGGTFLSSKLYPAGYNFASAEGNNHLSEEISKYNYNANIESTKMMNDWKSAFDSLHSQIMTKNASLSMCLARFDAFTSCLAGYSSLPDCRSSCNSTKDMTSYSSCGNASVIDQASCLRYPPSFVPSIQFTNLRLKDIFSNASYPLLAYDSFPKCKSTCAGPNEAIILTATQSCSCMAEWLFNSSLVRAAVACLFFMSINTSRVLLVKGISYINWSTKDMQENAFELKLNCDLEGRILNFNRENIAESIKELEKRIQNKGYLCVITSIIIIGAWIFIFPTLNYSTTYDPNTFH